MKDGRRTNKLRRFFRRLENPPNWIAVIAIGSAVVVCPLALLSAVLGYGRGLLAFVAYAICVLVFLYSVIVAIGSVRKARRKVLNVADRYEFTRNLRRDYKFRLAVFAVFAFALNIGYTVLLGVMAIATRSSWYGAMAVYYILLSTARGGVLIQDKRDERRYKYDGVALKKEKIGTYKYCGIMILALSVALAVSVVEAVANGEGFRVPSWAVYPFIGVAVYRIISAVLGFVRSMRYPDLVVRAVEHLNLSATLVAVLSLQTAMLSRFAPNYEARVLNAVTGGLVCLITLAIGIFMVLHARKEKARYDGANFVGKDNEYVVGYNRDGYFEEYGADDHNAK